MTLKFSRNSASRKQSPLQRIQWNQFAALGYSIAIRGYLLCWRELLIRAHISDSRFIWPIDEMLSLTREIERRARWNLRHLDSVERK